MRLTPCSVRKWSDDPIPVSPHSRPTARRGRKKTQKSIFCHFSTRDLNKGRSMSSPRAISVEKIRMMGYIIKKASVMAATKPLLVRHRVQS
jgi:hypothetical protein